MSLSILARPTAPQLLTIFVIASIFGALAFLYSFFGLFSNDRNNIPPSNAFGSLTFQEIGGHFLFGYIVALPTKNLKLGILVGFMALTIDTDHLLSASGFGIEGRMAHSVPFAILSSILIGLVASQILRKISIGNEIMPTIASSSSSSSSESERKQVARSGKDDSALLTKNRIFFQFLTITLAAFMSHIAYDVFVGPVASFPLFAPFSFGNIIIPQIYALPIEGIAVLFVYFIAQQKEIHFQ